MNDFQKQIYKTIDILTEQKLKNLGFDMTRRGKVISVNETRCIVEINGENYTCKLRRGIYVEPNDIVFVKFPQNNDVDKYVDTVLGGNETPESLIISAEEILSKLKTVDGHGSGLNADMLDGKHGSEYALLSDLDGVSLDGDTIVSNINLSNSIIEDKNLSIGVNNAINNNHKHTNKDVLDATTASYTITEKNKLDGIQSGANKYIHPETHQANMIVESAEKRFVSDIEKSTWNTVTSKVDKTQVLTDVPKNAKFTDTLTTINNKTGIITKDDIVALGIPAQDTVYVHPSGTNPHGTTKLDIGLENVDNTSDIDKPVSSLVQVELDKKVDNSRVKTDVPANAKFTDTIVDISGKADKTYVDTELGKKETPAGAQTKASKALTDAKDYTDIHESKKDNPHFVTKTQVGLGNVENKSSATIRNEITSENITIGLGYSPIKNSGDIPEIKSGIESARSLPTNSGMLYLATDTKKIWKDVGTWVQMGGQELPIATNSRLGGVKIGANLTISGDGTLSAMSGEEMVNFIVRQETFVSTSNQTVFNLTQGSYQTNTNMLSIYLYGGKLSNASFAEISPTSFEFNEPLEEGTVVIAEYFELASGTPYPIHGSDHLTGGFDPIPLVTTTKDGLMSSADKVKLNSVETGANKYTHPSTHPASIITESTTKRFVSDAEKATWDAKETPEDAQTKATKALTDSKAYVDGKVKTDVPVGAKFTDTIYVHPAGTNPHSTTKADVGLGNADNTSDVNKPVSTAQQSALNLKVDKSQVLTNVPANAQFTDTVTTVNGKTGAIAKEDIVALGIPAQDTNTTYAEITTAEIDAGTSATLRTITGRRIQYVLNKVSSLISAITKSDIGLGNVENKSSATIRGEITNANVTSALGYTPLNLALKGANSGLAELDSSGKVPSSQLPSYVDDVLEFTSLANFPSVGETGKIYTATNTNIIYRWSGSGYVEISSTIALGETSATAYRGDRGKVAYDHSQTAHAPSNAQKNSDITKAEIEAKLTGVVGTHGHTVTKSDVGLSNVDNTSDLAKPISTATQTALDGKVDNSKVLTNVPAGAKFTDTNTTYTNGSGLLLTGTVFSANFGNTAGTITQGNDSRLSDARTPLSHVHTKANITDFAHSHPVGDITSLQSALDLKSNLSSPTFVGTPTAPTAPTGNNTTQIATTAFVQNSLSGAGLGDMLRSVYDKNGDGIVDVSKGIVGDDTRTLNSPPSEYMSTGSRYLSRAGWQTEFKNISTMGLSGRLSGTYCYVETKNPWSDPSGGYPIQIAYGDGSPQWRIGKSLTAWSDWEKMSDNGNASTINGFTVEADVPANAKFTDTIYIHPGSGTNPHGTTKADVLLGSVLNYGIATQSESEAGSSNSKYMTPLRVKQAIGANPVYIVGNTQPTNNNLLWINTSL